MAMTDHGYTAAAMANELARGLLGSRSVLVVPCCNWTGHECDLLCIDRKSLKVVDVELKISRADLKADPKKSKWQHGAYSRTTASPKRLLSDAWPHKVWKHYYVMPASIWRDGLAEEAGLSPASGIVLLRGRGGIVTERRAKPNPAALPISPSDCIDLARLASLRMWAALNR